LAFFVITSVCVGAEQPTDNARETAAAKARQTRSSTTTKGEPVKIVSDGVMVNDGVDQAVPVVPVTPTPAPADGEKKNVPLTPEAAAEAERIRVADEASALARGEGDRYIRRQKAYEAARAGLNRAPVVPVKSSSVAQLQLADGSCVVMAGSTRKVFPNKEAADAYVAEIKLAEANRPIVLDAGPSK
jgi:hypothetical protein